MVRSGGFSSGLNPFGAGSLGNLGQYDIGADLADLEVYKTEVAWGNGLATNEDYIAALTKAVNATDPNTQRRETAQNKLDNANYQIGRSVADAKGIDDLIAFDTAAIAKMKVDNVRYNSVKNSLDSELAQRRSRDYGKLVTDYNAGKTSTQSLLAWVTTTVGSLAADAPDLASWTGVKADLTDRIVTEKDSQVYQDFQQGKTKAPAFLAYITSRRDSYAPASPQFADWSRKLEDAQKQVTDTAQSAKDAAFFDRYDEGKVSDATYLGYLRTRISGMTPDDPQREEWKHRLTQATFSLAEDKLRFAVQMSKSASTAKANTSHLISFYQAYRRTLNPSSAEWRTITRNLDALHAGGGSSGGGGTSSGGGKAGTGNPGLATGPGPALKVGGKAISPKYTLSNILGLFSVNPLGKSRDVAAAKKFLSLNESSLHNALQDGDHVWLFFDPRNPNATVAELDPQGNPTGRKVRGSAYLPVSSEAYSNIKTVESSNLMSQANVALAKGKYGDYATAVRMAGEALDSARLTDAQYRQQNWESWYKATSTAVDNATKAGDYAGAVKLSLELASRLATEAQNPYLDDTRRTRIDELGDKLAANPLLPKTLADGTVQEGAVNLSELANGNVQLNPGWHHVLKGDDNGRPAWGPVYDDKQDGSWEQNHVTVHTVLGQQIVTGEVATHTAKLDPMVYVQTDQGVVPIQLQGSSQEISYPDEHGILVRAYSLDGQTWISPESGMPAPTVQINANLTQVQNPDGSGALELVDAATGATVFTQGTNGAWAPDGDYFANNPDAKAWYGQAGWDYAKSTGERAPGDERPAYLNDMEVGGPGQHMTLATMSPSGAINLVPSGFPTSYADLGRATKGSGPTSGNDMGIPAKAPTSYADLGRATVGSGPTSGNGMGGFAPSYILPPDTPPRYDSGRAAIDDRRAPLTTIGPATSLPGLTPPKSYAALGRATVGSGPTSGNSMGVPALKAVATVGLTRAAKDDAILPPPIKTSAGITSAAASNAATNAQTAAAAAAQKAKAAADARAYAAKKAAEGTTARQGGGMTGF